MDLPLDAEVRCADGVCGRSTNIVLDPVTEQVTHIVVTRSGPEGGEYLVPVDVITESTATTIQLRWTNAELLQAEPFARDVFLGEDEDAYLETTKAAGSLMWPYFQADQEHVEAMMAAGFAREEQIPANELAVRRGATVMATDGQVGEVGEFLVDRATSHISHLVLRTGHLWGKRDITIPVGQIDRVEAQVVYLKLDRQAVGSLPSTPVRRR